ncbi:MAG TPA: hypothetical protein VHE13_08745 [Opitutus sp.]|nr:hypothetical protein [Opitutus sp.]
MNAWAESNAPADRDDPPVRLPESEWAGFLRGCNRAHLERLLQALAIRLGTAAERERDLERVRAVARALNDRLMAERRRRGPLPPS